MWEPEKKEWQQRSRQDITRKGSANRKDDPIPVSSSSPSCDLFSEIQDNESDLRPQALLSVLGNVALGRVGGGCAVRV